MKKALFTILFGLLCLTARAGYNPASDGYTVTGTLGNVPHVSGTTIYFPNGTPLIFTIAGSSDYSTYFLSSGKSKLSGTADYALSIAAINILSGTFSPGTIAQDLGMTITGGTSLNFYDASHTLQHFSGGGSGGGTLTTATSTSPGLTLAVSGSSVNLSGTPTLITGTITGAHVSGTVSAAVVSGSTTDSRLSSAVQGITAGTNITTSTTGNIVTVNSTGGGSGTLTTATSTSPGLTLAVSGSSVNLSGTPTMITGTIANTQVSGLGTASTQASSAFDASGAAATAQAYAIQRANHTGTQSPNTISSGTFGGGVNLPYSQLLSAPTIPSNTNQLTNGNGFITATGTASTITGTISNTQVSGLGSAALVSSTTFATIAQLAATNTIYVSPNGSNTTGTANDPTRPFATLTGGTGAFAAAQALGKPSLILMASGSYSEANSIVTGSSNITISGMGQPATSLYFTGSSGIMVSSSNITIQNIALNRIGSNGAQVLGCSGTGFASYIYGFVMNNVGVTNVSGTAIGTFMGNAYNCNITGMTAIDWCYGGILNNSTIIGHDPALSATTYCIKDIQSVSNPNNNRAIWSQLIGCYLVDDDTLGCVLNGISESATGDRISSRYTPSFSGSVSAYPSKIVGCYLEGPVYTNRTGYYTGFVVRGTLRFAGTEVYGCSNTLSYIHDSDGQLDVIGLEASGTNTALVDHIRASEFRAGTWVTYGLDQYTNISDSIWQGCNIQNNAEQQIRGMQKYFVGCVATGVSPNPPDIIGWQNANDMALRLSGTTYSIADIGYSSPIYNSPNMTVEFWFRSNNCNDSCCLISWNQTFNVSSWGVYAQRTTSPQIYWYGGGNSCIKTGQVMDGTWHHFAATVTSGTSVSVFVDGTYGATSAITAISGSGDMIIGAHNNGSNNVDYFQGDIAALRISSVNRYPGTSSFTPKINFPVDSCTIGLWASQQDGPEVWKDQTNTNNIFFNWQPPAQTNPYWVRRALPYTLY